MWLDRFSNNSPLQPQSNPPSRNYSPAPRRPPSRDPRNVPLRPAFGPRSSSLVPSANGQIPTRQPSGSGLRNQVVSSTQSDFEDPLTTLERIVALKVAAPVGDDLNPQLDLKRPVELDQAVEFGVASLQDFVQSPRMYSKNVRVLPWIVQHYYDRPSRFSRKGLQCRPADKGEQEQFEDLHRSIAACDKILGSVEKYLTGFQADLGTVSTEIETLQSRSTTLTGNLENREKLDRLLAPTIEKISLAPAVVRKLSDGPVDEEWVKALQELQSKIKAVEAAVGTSKEVRSIRDLEPLYADLSRKASQRIRDYFVTQIKSLRSPNVNAQVIQKQEFLKFRSLFSFLVSHQSKLAEEIIQAYAYTMRWYYLSHFTRYQTSLSKLRLFNIDRHHVLGEEPQALRKPTTLSANTNPGSAASNDPFNLSHRLDVLRNPGSVALPSHAAEEVTTTQNIETPFVALNLAILDNASFEFFFLTHFIPDTLYTTNKISALFNTIFSPTLSLGTSLTKSLITDSFDTLGVLLLLRLTQHLSFTMQRRKIPVLDSYHNGTIMLLWPRFQVVMDAHSTSLQKLASSLPSRSGGASAAIASLSGFISQTATSSTVPHPITQRFASLVAGIVSLSAADSDSDDVEPVAHSLARLRSDFEALLTKMASQAFGAGERARKERERFLSNNSSLILAIVGDGNGKLGRETKDHFAYLT